MNQRFTPCLVVLLLLSAIALRSEEVKLTREEGKIRVEVGGKLFTEYVFTGATRPYLYPVLAADGTPLTRNFPMKDVPGEEHDHPWHRSMVFQHSDFNDVDFWNEPGGGAGAPKDKGKTVQTALLETRDGREGVIRVANDYIAPDGRLICTDERTYRFHGAGEQRFIDVEITWRARPDTDLKIGDNKDGTIAIRVAQWMTMPHIDKPTGKQVGGKGHIVTAKGDRDADAWGKRADWCDYHAEHDGKIYGVAIFDHPANLRHPTWWMARDYGLFAANPFGWHDFEPKTTERGAGNYTVPAGGSLTLRHRFYFHTGDEAQAKVAERYAEYVAASR